MQRFVLTICWLIGVAACAGEAPSGPWPPLKDADLPFQNHTPQWPGEVSTGIARGDRLIIADEYGVYRSDDGGRGWARLKMPSNRRILELASSEDGQQLIAVARHGIAYHSGDGGKSWTLRKLYDDLPIDMRQLRQSWEGFGLSQVRISGDFQNWLLVGFCEGFISRDGGESWLRLTGNEDLGSWDHYDLCLNEIVLDEHFEPVFATVDVTGRLAAADYVFANRGDHWQELCTFDAVAMFIKSVVDCNEVEEIRDNARLFGQYHENLLPWPMDVDPEAAVFEQHQLVVNPVGARHFPSQLIGNEEGTTWFFSYKGIARSTDGGGNWQTMIGGIPAPERQVRTSETEVLALWDDQVFWSANGTVWQREPSVDYVYAFEDLGDAALVAARQGVLRISAGRRIEKVSDETVYRLEQNPGVVWGLGSELLLASSDGGLTWQSTPTQADSSQWLCAGVCLVTDDWGKVWEVALESSGLELSVVGQLPQEIGEDDWIDSPAAADDLSMVVVGVRDGLQDLVQVYISTDLGRNWDTFPRKIRDIEHILFPGPGIALVEGAGEVHWIRDAGMTSERSPVPTDAGVACVPGPGQIVLETWDVHPRWPDDDAQYIVYTRDMGESWWTMRSEQSVCP